MNVYITPESVLQYMNEEGKTQEDIRILDSVGNPGGFLVAAHQTMIEELCGPIITNPPFMGEEPSEG